MLRKFGFSVIFPLLALVITGCLGFGAPASKPTVIIASPPSGSVYALGEEVVVQSTSTDPAGVVRVALLVDGIVVREDPSPVAQGQAQFSLIQSWVAEGLGQHTLTVRATNTQGASSEGGIIINVREQAVNPEPPTVVAIATAVPLATATAAPTAIPQTDVPSPTVNPAVTVIVTATGVSPTQAPLPTATTACVYNSKFVADVTIPDGTIFVPNAVFTKTWRVLNTGNCAWENVSLAFVSGTQMAASNLYPVPLTQPGATADLVVPMTAPANYGSYTGTWRMRNSQGTFFGTNLTVVINVPSPATAVPPTNTPPPTVAGCSGQPNDFDFSASSLNINAGQSVTLSWGAVTNASEVRLHGGEFNNEGVAAPGNRVVSPGATTQYKLTAKCNNSGQTREKSLTVTVNAAVGNFAGNWVMNFGNMNLTQNGNNVNGTYNQLFYGTSGSIAGTVSGNKFTGTWSISGGSGSVELNLSGDGKRFTGKWNDEFSWCGARPGENFPNNCSYAGTWNAKLAAFPNCPMTLQRHDNIVTGNYCNGIVNGTLSYDNEETVLTGNWDTGGSIGTVKFFLDGFNALQFRGNYNDSNEWCGWRNGQSAPAPCKKP